MLAKLLVLGTLILASGCQDLCTMEYLFAMAETGYNAGYTKGKSKAEVVTIYLCHDWIPSEGYIAWRQCNVNEVVYKEKEHE